MTTIEVLVACLGVAGTVIGSLTAFILSGISKDLKELTNSMSKSNERHAMLEGRVDYHDIRLTHIEDKL